MVPLTERYAAQIAGVLSCYHRVVITGTLPGVCYLRVLPWAPCRLQFYCNAHNWLGGELRREGIAFNQLDNTFSAIADFPRAQALADAFPVAGLHRALDAWAARCCPVLAHFGV